LLTITQKGFLNDKEGEAYFSIVHPVARVSIGDDELDGIHKRLKRAFPGSLGRTMTDHEGKKSRRWPGVVNYTISFSVGSGSFLDTAFQTLKTILETLSVTGQDRKSLRELEMEITTTKYVRYRGKWMDTATYRLVKYDIREWTTVPEVPTEWQPDSLKWGRQFRFYTQDLP
jgi:hypothetical protein